MYSVNTKQRSRELFPDNPVLQARWAIAVNYLRSGPASKWILDGQFKPNWTSAKQ